MEYLIDSIRRIISRWVNTNAALTASASPGDTIIEVTTSKRFQVGDEVMLRNPTTGETPLYVDEIVDDTHIQLTTPIRFTWRVSETSILEKTFNQMFIQGIYVGEPDNIPMYPAITVNGVSRDSEWLTLDSSKEQYRLSIAIYVNRASQEAAYRFLLNLVDTIQHGLKQNIYPLVAPYEITTPKVDIVSDDEYIKVNDVSIFNTTTKHRILIEDLFKTQEFVVVQVVDAETIRVSPAVCDGYLIADGAKVISVKRFFYNSWPDNIEYGTIFKGTLLKAATISWFAWEEELQKQNPIDVSLT